MGSADALDGSPSLCDDPTHSIRHGPWRVKPSVFAIGSGVQHERMGPSTCGDSWIRGRVDGVSPRLVHRASDPHRPCSWVHRRRGRKRGNRHSIGRNSRRHRVRTGKNLATSLRRLAGTKDISFRHRERIACVLDSPYQDFDTTSSELVVLDRVRHRLSAGCPPRPRGAWMDQIPSVHPANRRDDFDSRRPYHFDR